MTMKRFFALTGLLLFVSQPLAFADGELTLKDIMQGLRDGLIEMADGLLADNFEQVASGALSIAEHPKIPPDQVQLVVAELGEEMPIFKQLDLLVHDLALEVHAAAVAQDRQAAIAGYQRMAEGCFDCHAGYKERVAAALADASVDL